MDKNYCPTHHLYYTGQECPLCASERVNGYAKKFSSKPKEEKVIEKEISEEDLNKLKDKFNKK